MRVDVCVYGGTLAGVIVAYTLSRQGKSVLLVEPTGRIGGLTTGGLGQTDIGNINIIQGFALNFYSRIGHYYGSDKLLFKFEPRAALTVYNQLLNECDAKVLYFHRIVKVEKEEMSYSRLYWKMMLNLRKDSISQCRRRNL